MAELKAGQKYACNDCGYVCTPEQMGADAFGADYDTEVWSNCICPGCKAFHRNNNWTEVSDAPA